MQIAGSLPHRKFTSVWSRLFRLTHAANGKGAWTPGEDSRLLELHRELGPKWKRIGGEIGRLPEGCRDRWRTIGAAPGKHAGRWAKAEEAALSAAVMDYDKAVGLVRSVPLASARGAACGSTLACRTHGTKALIMVA